MIIGPDSPSALPPPPGTRDLDLTVVIVSYNVAYFLEQTLLSVRRAAAGPDLAVEVYVVDNVSQDDSVAMTRARFPEVHCIANADNVGFSRANNQALRLARGRHCLLLNPDTVVEDDTFRACLGFMAAHPDCGGLGVRMLDGRGRFLPESKRGLPTPWVAFSKIFGLAGLFPRSPRFAGYHLGYLPEHQTHPIDVLSGAFMWMRTAALDAVGLLDEAYFMYGEDIDLSYRLQLGGWTNYYFPGARIIHYKGESTKRTTVNYVRVFYRAMAIFARKHFAPRYATAFGLLIDFAIVVRATAAVLRRAAVAALPVALDAGLIFGGMALLKTYWEANHKYVRTPYPPQYLLVAVPAYIAVWLTSAYLSGAYDGPADAPHRGITGRLTRGVVVGTVLISAVSNFLDAWRFSKALIVLGGAWAVAALVGRRVVTDLVRYRELRLGGPRRARRLAIVGSEAEAARVEMLLQAARVEAEIVGRVAVVGAKCEVRSATSEIGAKCEVRSAKSEVSDVDDKDVLLTWDLAPGTSHLASRHSPLDSLIGLYQLDEIIFCNADVPTARILDAMEASRHRPVEFKILPEGSAYIIGSASKNAPGDYYTRPSDLNLYRAPQRRAQRLFNGLSALVLLLLAPTLMWTMRRPLGFVRNAARVLGGRASWVGLRYAPEGQPARPAILSPADAAGPAADAVTRRRLELLYAKDYAPTADLEILLRQFRDLGRA